MKPVHPTSCDDCEFEAKSPKGLVLHRRAKHPEGSSGANAEAMETTLAELERLGRFERVDAAKVQALRSMARSLDENPYNSQMWATYWASVNEVLEADDDADGRLEEALGAIRAASVGDTPPS